MFSVNLIQMAEALIAKCRAERWRITTAESCTGGLVSSLLTSIPGASDVFDMGFVTYSNAAKSKLISVPEILLATHGAVSAEVAEAMAEGALATAHANLALAITGIAGPGGGSAEKPVGLVYIACAKDDMTICEPHHFAGNRESIRLNACEKALEMALPILD